MGVIKGAILIVFMAILYHSKGLHRTDNEFKWSLDNFNSCFSLFQACLDYFSQSFVIDCCKNLSQIQVFQISLMKAF